MGKTISGWVQANPKMNCSNCDKKVNLIDGRLKIDRDIDDETEIEKDEIELICRDCAE